MSFLKQETWTGQVYSGGWIAAEGGDMPVTEPATGRELGRIGDVQAAGLARPDLAEGVGPFPKPGRDGPHVLCPLRMGHPWQRSVVERVPRGLDGTRYVGRLRFGCAGSSQVNVSARPA
jgi:hypothetical protein